MTKTENQVKRKRKNEHLKDVSITLDNFNTNPSRLIQFQSSCDPSLFQKSKKRQKKLTDPRKGASRVLVFYTCAIVNNWLRMDRSL